MAATERDPANSGSEEESDVDNGPSTKRETIPDAVDHFLGKLNDSLKVRNVSEINKLYEDSFNKLTEKYYKSKHWPKWETVAEQLGIDDPKHNLFIILYKELYYRHVYTKLTVTFEDRQGSWENYTKLLDLFILD